MTKQQSTPTFTISPTRPFFVPVVATPAQLIPTAGVARDMREWEANEYGRADERFSAKGGR